MLAHTRLHHHIKVAIHQTFCTYSVVSCNCQWVDTFVDIQPLQNLIEVIDWSASYRSKRSPTNFISYSVQWVDILVFVFFCVQCQLLPDMGIYKKSWSYPFCFYGGWVSSILNSYVPIVDRMIKSFWAVLLEKNNK